MSFDDFKKDDLDFGGLITSKKPKKKKFPKSSEGLRFLERNFKNDSSKREISKSKPAGINIEKVLQKELSKPPFPAPSDNEAVSNKNVLNSSIDNTRTKDTSTPKSSIDDKSTERTHRNQLNTSIDKISANTTEPKLSIDNKRTLSNGLYSSMDEISSETSKIKSSQISHPVKENKIVSPSPKITNIVSPIENLELTENVSFDNASVETNKSEFLDQSGIDEHQELISSIDDIKMVGKNLDLQTNSIDKISTDKNPSTNLDSSIVVLSTLQGSQKSSIDNSSTEDTGSETVITSIDDISTIAKSTSLPDNCSIKLKGNFTKLSNHTFKIWKDLNKTEKILFLYLYRTSYGWNKKTTNIPLSIRFLEKALPLTHNSIPKGLKGLISKGLIKAIDSSKLGSTYELFLSIDDKSVNVPITDFYTALDNNFFELSHHCSTSDMLVYMLFYRYSFGFNQNITKTKILTSKLSKEVGLSVRRTQDAIRNLIKLSLIKRISDVSSQGISYRVLLPQEVFNCEKLTELDHKQLNPTELISSIDGSPQPKVSIDDSRKYSSKTSIDKTSHNFNQSPEVKINQGIADDTLLTSIDKTGSKEIENTKKTSSKDAADFFDFLKSKFENPTTEFPISKNILNEILGSFGLKTSKHHLERLLSRIKEAKSPVGFWRHSLSNPENFPELTQKTQLEILQEQRKREAEERRVELVAKKQEQDKIKRINTAWNILDEIKQNEFIAESEKYFRDSMNGSLPPKSAIVERAQRIYFQSSQNHKNEPT